MRLISFSISIRVTILMIIMIITAAHIVSIISILISSRWVTKPRRGASDRTECQLDTVAPHHDHGVCACADALGGAGGWKRRERGGREYRAPRPEVGGERQKVHERRSDRDVLCDHR